MQRSTITNSQLANLHTPMYKPIFQLVKQLSTTNILID